MTPEIVLRPAAMRKPRKMWRSECRRCRQKRPYALLFQHLRLVLKQTSRVNLMAFPGLGSKTKGIDENGEGFWFCLRGVAIACDSHAGLGATPETDQNTRHFVQLAAFALLYMARGITIVTAGCQTLLMGVRRNDGGEEKAAGGPMKSKRSGRRMGQTRRTSSQMLTPAPSASQSCGDTESAGSLRSSL